MSTIKLTNEGYSFHTLELKVHPDGNQYHKALGVLYSAAEKTKKHDLLTYPLPKYQARAHCSTMLSPHGILLYLTETGTHGYTIKAVVNPRRVLDPKCSYLGIAPTDEESLERFQDEFTVLMRKYHLLEFLDEWTLTRLDLCVNLQLDKKKSARELCRLLQKDLLPSKMERVFFFDPDAGKKAQEKQKQADRHSICLKNDSYGIVVYDKLFQAETEGLLGKDAWHDLPGSILRLELRCFRTYLKKLAKERGLNSTSEQLYWMARHSRELILKRVNQAFSSGTHYKPDTMKALIEESKFQCHTRDQLLWMTDRMRYPFNIRQLEKGMKREFDVKPRTVAKRLEQLQELNINPIPLRKDFYLSQLPSFPEVLELLEDEYTKLRLDSDGRVIY